MFAEDHSWQQNDKLAVIQDLVRQQKRQQTLERSQQVPETGLQAEGLVEQAQASGRRGRLFGRQGRAEDYYEEFVAKNLAASREESMTIVVWPWASWLLGFTALVSAAVIVVYCKQARQFSVGILAAVAVLVGVGLAFLLFGSLEVVEGSKSAKTFLIRKMAICRSKIVKLKWSQVKKVEAVMGGDLTTYDDSIHYFVEFETIAGGRITCLETSDRKKIKQRVVSGHQVLLLKMFMGRPFDAREVPVLNKTANQARLDEQVRLASLRQL